MKPQWITVRVTYELQVYAPPPSTRLEVLALFNDRTKHHQMQRITVDDKVVFDKDRDVTR